MCNVQAKSGEKIDGIETGFEKHKAFINNDKKKLMMQKITLYKIKIIENTIEGNNSNNEKKAEFTQRRSTTALINTDLQDTVIIVFSVSKVASVTPKILPSSPLQPPAPKISPSILNLLSYKVLNFNSIDSMFLSVWIYG